MGAPLSTGDKKTKSHLLRSAGVSAPSLAQRESYRLVTPYPSTDSALLQLLSRSLGRPRENIREFQREADEFSEDEASGHKSTVVIKDTLEWRCELI